MVVHGEREVLPSATRAEAAKALTAFTTAYNKADKAYDSSLDADHVTGALGDIDAGRLKAGHKNYPGGNPAYSPLEFSDPKFTIPKKAGWPRWFVAEARGNKGGDAHWLLVFTRDDLGDPWQVAYLTLITPGSLPELKKDKDGWAEAVPVNSTGLAVPPADLSRTYTAYLKNGGRTFADGPHTSNWRALRAKAAKQPGLATQFIDEPLTSGDYGPLALRTQDGGALVFFAHRRYQKLTAAANASIPTQKPDVLALVSGEIKQSLTMEFMSNEVALDPKGGGQVSVLTRLEGMTSGTGS